MSRATDYREKYLNLLQEQETFEKQSKYQLETMRATLYKLGIAASGLDANVDANFLRLRETMRGGKGSDAIAQMERLNQSITQFEANRLAAHQQSAQSLSGLIAQYQALKLPADTQAKLKAFAQELPQKLAKYRDYSSTLNELIQLQKTAFQAAMNPDLSLWERVKNKRTLIACESETTPKDDSKKTDSQNTQPDIQEENVKTITRNQGEKSADEKDENEKDTSTKNAIKERFTLALQSLVDKIEPNPAVENKIQQVKNKLQENISYEELAVTLEDIRDILFLRYLKVDEDFSQYLEEVNGALASIREALSQAHDASDLQQTAAENLSNAVFDQVGNIQQSLHASNDVNLLKKEVAEHISFIKDALNDYKNTQPDENSLTEQLKALVDRVQSVEQESEKAREQLEEQKHKATHDALTGLPNREAYNERSALEWQRLKRYAEPLTLAVCDIDHFKKINDTHGHQAGDKVLQLVAKFISSRLREVDFVARYGGEEFVALLPNTTVDNALHALDKIRKAISETPIRFKDEPIKVTLSFGLVECSGEITLQESFEKADSALYEAKGSGRNRCIAHSEAP